jgi:hypothetical protein
MKKWVCKNCGSLDNPVWCQKGNRAFHWFLMILFIPYIFSRLIAPAFGAIAARAVWGNKIVLEDFWKRFAYYPICSECRSEILFPADSPEGQRVLERNYLSNKKTN